MQGSCCIAAAFASQLHARLMLRRSFSNLHWQASIHAITFVRGQVSMQGSCYVAAAVRLHSLAMSLALSQASVSSDGLWMQYHCLDCMLVSCCIAAAAFRFARPAVLLWPCRIIKSSYTKPLQDKCCRAAISIRFMTLQPSLSQLSWLVDVGTCLGAETSCSAGSCRSQSQGCKSGKAAEAANISFEEENQKGSTCHEAQNRQNSRCIATIAHIVNCGY